MKTTASLALILVLWFKCRSDAATFTDVQIPPYGSPLHVRGKVPDVDPTKFGVSLWIDVFGTLWPKPTFERPISMLTSDGTFDIAYASVGTDLCARKFYLFVVPLDLVLPSYDEGQVIPGEVPAAAIAYLLIDRQPEVKMIDAFGYQFAVKDTLPCEWAPGPNNYSKDNAFADAAGMHLRITVTNGVWYCPEVVLTKSLGYGVYKIWVDTDLSNFPENIVISPLFLYDDDPAFYHRESDIEISNGQVVGKPLSFQFTVQSYLIPEQRHRFAGPSGETNTVFSLAWLSGIVSFSCYTGRPQFSGHAVDYGIDWMTDLGGFRYSLLDTVSVTPPGKAEITDASGWYLRRYFSAHLAGYREIADKAPFEAWTDTSGVPPTGNEKVHMNMWLFGGQPPSAVDGVYEVVISKFTFEPLEPALFQPSVKILDLKNANDRDQASTSVRLQLSLPPE